MEKTGKHHNPKKASTTGSFKRVYTYGTFDLLHPGHVNLLKRAREYGDRLIVAVSTDEFNVQKGKKAVLSFEERVEVVGAVRWVDEVIAERTWGQKYRDIGKGDILVMGDDWRGEFDDLPVIYLPRTPGVSTSDLIARVKTLT